jgi:hypothetical protein
MELLREHLQAQKLFQGKLNLMARHKVTQSMSGLISLENGLMQAVER